MKESNQKSVGFAVKKTLNLCTNFLKPGSEVLLWCDGNRAPGDDELGKSRKRKYESLTKREEKEEEVDSIYADLELKDKHSQKYEIPKLRLWARMMAGGSL